MLFVQIKNLFHIPKAGNVVTGDMVEALIFAGADIIKVYDIKGSYISFCMAKISTR